MIGLLLSASLALGAETPDPLFEPLAAELHRSEAELSLPGAPPIYHLRYKALVMDQVDAEASLGSLVATSTSPLSLLFVEVRVGGPAFDNTGFGGWQNGFVTTSLTLEPHPRPTRTSAWRATDQAYKEAVEQYARKIAQFVPPEDYPGDYTLAEPMIDDLGSEPAADPHTLVSLARALSGAMAIEPEGDVTLDLGMVHVGHEAGAYVILDTEGTHLRFPAVETTLRATAAVRAADGMLITDQRLWTVRRPEDLPPREDMLADAEQMTRDLYAAAAAPALADEYVGPVIFEDGAALDLFRYVLVPQLQGTPAEVPFDSFFGDLGGGRNDAVRLKRRVLPQGWRVEDDPTLHPDYASSFAYDAEGTPARPVSLVYDGIVRELLMSRVPRSDLRVSNGHARGGMGERAQGRAAQMSVRPDRHLSKARLRKRALKLAAAYGRDWVIVVQRLQDPAARNLAGRGMVFMSSDNTELPPPVRLVKLYADGREEPVRGAHFAGVQRFVLRDIVAAGPQVEAHFMASAQGEPWTYGPTEGLPTWLSVPEVLVGEIELVPSPADAMAVPVLAPPPLSARP